MKIYLSLFFALIISLSYNNVYAQAKKHTKKTIAVTTTDGNIYIGKLLKETKKIIRIKTESAGNLTIKKKKIKSIDFDYIPGSDIAADHESKKGYKDYPSRYFMGTSGYNLKKGEGYYANIGIFFNEFNYGITDYFSAGIGVVPLFLFAGAPSPVWLKTKFSYPVVKNKFNISGGIMAGTIVGYDVDFVVPVMFYAAGTYGSRDNNITLSLNYGYFDAEFSPAIFTVGGKYKITRRTFIMSDNYFILGPDIDFGLISTIGARTLFKGLSLDYGATIPIGQGLDAGLFILPYLGIKVGVGK
ncbi:MAG TPA: hypothetical protein ENI82_06060 [Bacteroidetes bacterium]|nr:hypothetical protein [Bacteroidota bacterium]